MTGSIKPSRWLIAAVPTSLLFWGVLASPFVLF